MRDVLVILVLILAVGGFWLFKRADISPERARELIKQGGLLLDVRSPGEFASGHLDGARNVPIGEIGQHTSELGDSSRPIVVYCASGARSAMAKRTLRSAGFSSVYNLGAMSNW